MICCSDPIDLGCVSSCGYINTGYPLSGEINHYTIEYMFNGADVVFKKAFFGSTLMIPAMIFNESFNGVFAVKNDTGALVACYKVKISPAVSIGAMSQYRILDTLTAVEKVDCFTFKFKILFSDSTLLKNDSAIHFSLMYEYNTSIVPAFDVIYTGYDTNFIEISEDGIINVKNIDLMPDNMQIEFLSVFQSTDCDLLINVGGVVTIVLGLNNAENGNHISANVVNQYP